MRSTLAGAALLLVLGWSAPSAAEPEVVPAGAGPCCPRPTQPPAAVDCCPSPGQAMPGVPQFDSTGAPIAPTPGMGMNEGAALGTAGGRGAMTDVPLHGDQFTGLGGIFGTLPPTSFGPGQAVALSKAGVVTPAIRGFKIAENESPRPTDRVYYDFNYFDRVNDAVNKHFGTDVDRINAYRSTFGVEKTFLDGYMSIGFRLPLNTLEVDSSFAELQSTNTAMGDLSTILKFMPYQNKQNGDVFSFGLVVTAPTGSTNFGGTPIFTGFHSALLEPYIGYIFHYKNLFIEGFSAISVPTDTNDVTIMYNDIGIGYVYTPGDGANDNRWVTAIVPMLEVHANNPLNHQGAFQADDPAGTPDVVSFTAGVTFGIGRSTTVALAVVVPVTGPRPFDIEGQFQLNWYFGAPKR
jgi:hypothetical protein